MNIETFVLFLALRFQDEVFNVCMFLLLVFICFCLFYAFHHILDDYDKEIKKRVKTKNEMCNYLSISYFKYYISF